MAKAKQQNWLVYIIQCSDQSLYTGITTDMDKRFGQHKNKKGAKYFYGRMPEKIVFLEPGHDRSSAARREFELKRLNRAQKLSLIRSYQQTGTLPARKSP